MKTKVEIIRETYNYYAEDPNGRRAIDCDGRCLYLTFDGRRCAVGRVLNSEIPKNEIIRIPACIGIKGLLDNDMRDKYILGFPGQLIFDKEYREHDADFWADLQLLHDRDECWDNNANTISIYGIGKYNQLLENYKD